MARTREHCQEGPRAKHREDPDYLSRYRIRIYDDHIWAGKGNEVDPASIDWHSDAPTKLFFRQDPGPQNSLGAVRINMPSIYPVYMHDTPLKELFDEEYRFFSSACVRVENVQDLVVWLLRDTPGWGRASVEASWRSGQRLDAQLAAPTPVHWIYLTGWATADGVVHFRPDIYNLDKLDQVAATNAEARSIQ